jgi:hypothetical protein
MMSKNQRIAIRALFIFVSAGFLANLYPTQAAFSDVFSKTFTLGPTGLDLQDPTTRLVAASLNNTSDDNACKVRVDSIVLLNLAKFPISTQTKVPIQLGEINADESTTLQASFSSKQLAPGQKYLLVVSGDYQPKCKGLVLGGLDFSKRGFLATIPVTSRRAHLVQRRSETCKCHLRPSLEAAFRRYHLTSGMRIMAPAGQSRLGPLFHSPGPYLQAL